MKDAKSILGAGMGRRSFQTEAGATLAAPELAQDAAIRVEPLAL